MVIFHSYLFVYHCHLERMGAAAEDLQSAMKWLKRILTDLWGQWGCLQFDEGWNG